MFNSSENKLSYADKFGLDPLSYENEKIEGLPFSVRVVNRLLRNNITTLSELISTSPEYLSQINGFGAGCFEEIELFLSKLSLPQAAKSPCKKISDRDLKNIVKQHIEEISYGNFSFFEDIDKDSIKTVLVRYEEGFDILGKELVYECIYSGEKIKPIIQMFSDFSFRISKQECIYDLLSNIDVSRAQNYLMPYIVAFSFDEEKRNTLKSFCKTSSSTYFDLLTIDSFDDDNAYSLLVKFLKWSTFDIKHEIDLIFNSIFPNDKAKTVIRMRANKNTLEQTGKTLGLTRERVRQIESTVKRKFSQIYNRYKLLSKISADRNGESILAPSVIFDYFPDYGNAFLYLLRSIDSPSFHYDRNLDLFLIGCDSIGDRITNFIELLPQIITLPQLEEYKHQAESEEEIPSDLFTKSFFKTYKLTGEVYHRSRLSLAQIYVDIISNYYPNGIKVYDTDEINTFRKYINKVYGDIDLPENNRALTARITSACILCGRGMYRAKQKQYIPKELEKKINDYICQNPNPVLLTNTIFSVFEFELSKAGVTNKYFLQGILRELFGEKYTFRRDYISKDPNITSVYSSIVNFIKEHEYPVNKLEIQTAFPGITEIVLNFAVSDPEVLNFFGAYLHASHLKVSKDEKSSLFETLSEIISDDDSHHSKELYDIILRKNKDVLSKNAAMSPFQAFSILEYLFRDVFQFSRPYIAKLGVEIGRPGEILHDLIYSNDKFLVSDISEFCKENRYQIQSILEYIHECFDQYLLVDDNTLQRISSIGITDILAKEIDDILAEKIYKTLPINQLDLWYSLPQLNVPWTEWLLYSVIRKWGKKTIVSTSNNQFRLAVPIIAPKSCYNPDAFRDITRSTSSMFKIDNLDNIDELLEDIIDEDILEDF